MAKSVYRSKRSRKRNQMNTNDSNPMNRTEEMLNSFVKNWMTSKTDSIDIQQIISKLVNSSEGNNLLKNSTSILDEYSDSVDTSDNFDLGKILNTLRSNENVDQMEELLNSSEIRDQAMNMVNDILNDTSNKKEED